MNSISSCLFFTLCVLTVKCDNHVDLLSKELEQKLSLLSYDLQEIGSILKLSHLYQVDLNETESGDDEGLEDEDYNYDYDEYYDYYGEEEIEGEEDLGEEIDSVNSTEVNEIPSRQARLLWQRKRNLRSPGAGKQRVAKSGKKKKSKKSKKSKKGKKKQKGLSATRGHTRGSGSSVDLSPSQIRALCASQTNRVVGTGSSPNSGSGRRVDNRGGAFESNQFSEQFSQLTKAFAQLQSALGEARKNIQTSKQSGSTATRGVVDLSQGGSPGMGPLVQAAIGAQGAAADALRGLLPAKHRS